MSEAIIVALVTGVCAIIGAYVGQATAGAKTTNNLINELRHNSAVSDTEIKGDIAVIKTEIRDLREEVRKHNGVMERTAKLEQQAAAQEKQLEAVSAKVANLETVAR